MFESKFSSLSKLLVAVAAASAAMSYAQQMPRQGTGASEPPAAAATTPVAAGRGSPAASAIAVINERMSVKEAELSELELDAKLEAKRSEIAHLKRGPASQADDGSTPAVLEIGGVDGKFVASLVMPGGNVQSVRVGDTVGGWGVRQITVDAITLGRGKESKRLTFGAAATPAAGAAVPPGATSPNAPSLLAPRAQ